MQQLNRSADNRLPWELIGDGLRALEEKQATAIDNLRENESFIDTVLQASQAAVRTSQQ